MASGNRGFFEKLDMDNIITEKLKGFELKFKTRPGVFSQHGVDEGSKLLIETVDIRDGTIIADLGCGAGVIGLVAAKLNPYGHVHLLDSNIRAINLANENVDLNKFRNVEVFLSDLFSAVGERTYHQILVNPPQDLGNDFFEELAAESFKHLKPKGETVWVVQSHFAPFIEKLFKQVFKNAEVIKRGKIHVVIKGVKNGQ